jgi:hypothetical protein
LTHPTDQLVEAFKSCDAYFSLKVGKRPWKANSASCLSPRFRL